MERIRIDDRLTYLVPPKEARSSFLGCSGLLIEDRLTALVDGNMGPAETTPLLEETRPDVCIVSHYHADHSRWAHEAAASGSTLHVPEAEHRYLADVDHFVERCGIEDPELARLWKLWLTDFAGLRPVPSAVPLAPGETIELGSTRVEVVEAAGHSPGHQAYRLPAERILFCTDIGVDSFGPWYGWRDSDLETYVRSIRRLAGMDARLLLTSHGGIVSEDIPETILGCLDVMRAREGLVASELEAGRSIAEIGAMGHIYGDVSRFPPPLDRACRLWEENMVREHARLLERGGLDRIES